MKKTYTKPVSEIIVFKPEDVITTSGGHSGGNSHGGFNGGRGGKH